MCLAYHPEKPSAIVGGNFNGKILLVAILISFQIVHLISSGNLPDLLTTPIMILRYEFPGFVKYE